MWLPNHFSYIVELTKDHMPVLKCRECNAPMNVTNKDRPAKLPTNVQWLVCRQCNKGIEFIGGEGDNIAPATNIVAKDAEKMDFEEKVTVTNYVRISKITGENGVVVMKKEIFSDPTYTTLIRTENL